MSKPYVIASNNGGIIVSNVHVINPNNSRDALDLNNLTIAQRSDGKIEIEASPHYPASDDAVRNQLTNALNSLGEKAGHYLRAQQHRISGTVSGADLEAVTAALANVIQEPDVRQTLKDAATASAQHASRVKTGAEPPVGSLQFTDTASWEQGVQKQIALKPRKTPGR